MGISDEDLALKRRASTDGVKKSDVAATVDAVKTNETINGVIGIGNSRFVSPHADFLAEVKAEKKAIGEELRQGSIRLSFEIYVLFSGWTPKF